MPAFWSQALTNQSAARPAGSVPPMTHPKNRPDAIAISPGSAVAASSSTTAAGSVPRSGSGPPNSLSSSSAVARGPIGRSSIDDSHDRACACARSSAVSYVSRRAVIRRGLPVDLPPQSCPHPLSRSRRADPASSGLEDRDDALPTGGTDRYQAAARTFLVQQLGEVGDDASAGRGERVRCCQGGALDVELAAVDRTERHVEAQSLFAEDRVLPCSE